MTENTLTAGEVIASVMRDVQSVAKKDRNESQKFNFRGIDAVMNAVGPALRKAGGFIVPTVEKADYQAIPSKSGGSLNVAHLEVSFSVYGQTGEPIIGTVVAEAFDSGDKATAKAMSVAYRTFLLQLLCLPTDEPDPDSFSYEMGEVLADWSSALETASTRDDLLKLWGEAKSARAPKKVLEAIEAKGKTL
jgi:hypothetical protein